MGLIKEAFTLTADQFVRPAPLTTAIDGGKMLPEPTTTRSRIRAPRTAAAVLGVGLLAGCSSPSEAPATITTTVDLPASESPTAGGSRTTAPITTQESISPTDVSSVTPSSSMESQPTASPENPLNQEARETTDQWIEMITLKHNFPDGLRKGDGRGGNTVAVSFIDYSRKVPVDSHNGKMRPVSVYALDSVANEDQTANPEKVQKIIIRHELRSAPLNYYEDRDLTVEQFEVTRNLDNSITITETKRTNQKTGELNTRKDEGTPSYDVNSFSSSSTKPEDITAFKELMTKIDGQMRKDLGFHAATPSSTSS